MEIEEKFDIEIPDDDIHKLPTVGALTDYLERRLASEKAATA
jgi:acyl carrier protein